MTAKKEYFTNPCLHSRWTCIKRGIPVTYKIAGIWGIGSRENYMPVSYDMKPTHGGEMVKVSAEDLHRWIREKRINWIGN